MKKKLLNSRLGYVSSLLCALIILAIYLVDLKNDYYFYTSKKEVLANIKEIKKIEQYKPYFVTLKYFNDYIKSEEEVVLNLDARFGKKLQEERTKAMPIFYTNQNSKDVYIIDYHYPSIGGLIIHLFVFFTLIIGIIIFTKKIFQNVNSTIPKPSYADPK